jgi:hypothetical protein
MASAIISGKSPLDRHRAKHDLDAHELQRDVGHRGEKAGERHD